MKMTVTESLLFTWLKFHEKCQVVELNWSPLKGKVLIDALGFKQGSQLEVKAIIYSFSERFSSNKLTKAELEQLAQKLRENFHDSHIEIICIGSFSRKVRSTKFPDSDVLTCLFKSKLSA